MSMLASIPLGNPMSASASAKPREFKPTLGAAPTDQVKFDAAYAECKQLFVTGKAEQGGRITPR